MGKRGKCVICGRKFEVKTKGFKRFSLKAQLGQNFDTDVITALSKIKPEVCKFPEDGHVCDSCFRLLRSTLRQREQLLKSEIEWENRFQSGPCQKQLRKTNVGKKTRKSGSRTSTRTHKRKLEEEQNVAVGSRNDARTKRLKLEPTVAVLCKNGGHNNFMKKVIAYLLQYRYHKAFTTLITGSKRARKAFLGVLENEVRKEVFYFCKSAENCSHMDCIQSFSWKKECKTMESQLPTLFSACYAAMDTRKGTDLVRSKLARKTQIRPRLGLMMTLPLYSRRERKFGFVPGLLSLLLHRYGNNDKVLNILYHLGICRPVTVARTAKVEEMGTEECEKLLSWAIKNLGEVKPASTGIQAKKPSSRKGKLPTATRPPTDANISDINGSDLSSDDEENGLNDSNDDSHDDQDNEDLDDIDDSSLLNMLSSSEDEDEDDEEEEEEDDEYEEVWKEVGEEEVEVEGCIEDIEGQDVEMVLLDTYKALRGGS